ncbi:hypothetical protein ACB094_11G003700 [Castanea mollissima]
MVNRKTYFGPRFSDPNPDPDPNPKAIDPNGEKVTELRLELAGSGTSITFLELLITESRLWIAGSWSAEPAGITFHVPAVPPTSSTASYPSRSSNSERKLIGSSELTPHIPSQLY